MHVVHAYAEPHREGTQRHQVERFPVDRDRRWAVAADENRALD
jgi:hypothetical protein